MLAKLARLLRRRPPFRLALVVLVVGLTALTGVVIGGLAWRDQRARSRAILDAAMVQRARLTAAQTARFLEDAESVALLGPRLVQHGQLSPDDARAVERFALAVLESNPFLSWVSYGDVRDRFVGAWRNTEGDVFVNRSYPVGGRIRLEEDRLLLNGKREAVRRSNDHGYRPRERPYFTLAQAHRRLAWTQPYEFYAGGGLGITCAAPLLDERGTVRGVFTIDFSLDRLARFLGQVDASPRGRVFLATQDGRLLIGAESAAEASEHDAELVALVTPRATAEAESAFAFEHRGERYLARAVPIPVGELNWMVHAVVPERDFTEQADAQAKQAILLGLAALALALTAGLAFARWLALPLRELAAAARAIREGRLDDAAVKPRSRDEIGVLARAMGDMVRALRDRDLVREALGRYVNPILADRVLRDRDAMTPGGELRDVVILMSDLRGFSELSERLGAEGMIDVLNRYLARMTEVITEHGGLIDEFIGDAILVLFGVPDEAPDDADRAVCCAWAMQQALVEFNGRQSASNLPTLAMGIGIHAGRVVAGNIGSADRTKYGVVGPAVNVTSRIQAMSRGGQILISQPALERLKVLVRLTDPSTVKVKGAAEPITVHEVLEVL